MRTITLLLGILAAVPSTPKLPFVGESIEVSIVNVDVFVTDRAGSRVHGLTRDDFEIYEDGKLQPVANFTEYAGGTTHESVSYGGVAQPAVPNDGTQRRQKRTIVVFVDSFRLRPDHRAAMFGELRQSLHTLIEPGDAVSIVVWNEHAEVWVPFTDDLATVDAAIAALGKVAKNDLPDFATFERERAFEAEAGRLQARSGERAPERQSQESLLRQDSSLDAEVTAMRHRNETRLKTKAINALLSVMGAADGQKALLLLSEAMGLSSRATAIGVRVAAGVPPQSDQLMYMESIARTANANGVRVYGADPDELDVAITQTPDDSTMPSTFAPAAGARGHIILGDRLGAMQMIAERTGGEMTWHPAEIVRLLERMPDDFHDYYSLAYRATTTRADRQHRIDVKVKKRGLTVRSRTQFVERSDTSRMAQRVTAQLFAIPLPETKIPVTVRAGAAHRRGRQYVMPVSLEIPFAALTAIPDGERTNGAFSVFVAWSSGLGRLGDITHRTQTFSTPVAELDRARTGHLTYDFDVTVDSDVDRVSIGVLDEISHEYGLGVVDLAGAKNGTAISKGSD